MKRILIFGNSGSGKSTLAKRLSIEHGLAHLDLDTLAWLPQMPTTRRPTAESSAEISKFITGHPNWVIEGCYSDLLEVVAPHCLEMIFLNPGVETCVKNCQSRPWEPHKYPTKQAQDANLEMLIDWVRKYETRRDEFSLSAHRKIFDAFTGKKRETTLTKLRDVTEADLPILFEYQREPESVKMAAFPARDLDAFMSHWRTKVLPDENTKKKTILFNNEVVGDILSWKQEEKRLVGYWLGKAHWHQGIATAALREFVETHEKTRPLYAYVVTHNTASFRVLKKCGFEQEGEILIAPDGFEEILMRLG